jgi:hypothetical protein
VRFLDDYREQWVMEVETWFIKAILGAIFQIQDTALYSVRKIDSSFSDKYIREWSLCGRILFRDGDYININWIGFWATVGSLTLLCLVGNQVESVHEVSRVFVHGMGKIPAIVSLLSRAMLFSLWRHPVLFSQLLRLWNTPSLAEVFRTRRPWYGSRPSNTPVDNSELYDLNASSTALDNNISNSSEECENIDNVI